MPPSRSASDETDALERFVRRHQNGLWRYLRCLGCQPAEADDLVQEALIAVLGHAALQFPEDQARAYLRTVAKNAWRRRRRERGREAPVDLDAAEAVHDELLGAGGDAALRALDLCLATLSDRAREALRLRYEARCDRAAIADRLGASELAVKSMLSRSYAALRRCIQRRLRDEHV